MYAFLGTSRQLNVAPEAALSLLVGQAVGHADGKRSPAHEGKFSYKHSDVTFRALVADLEATTGIKLAVRTEMDQGLGVGEGKRKWDLDDKTRRLVFEIERLAE